MAIRSLLITNHLRNNSYCYKLQFEARNLVQFLLPISKPSMKLKYIHDNSSSSSRLETEILRLKSPSRALQNWANNGNKVKLSQLNVISKQLLKSRRYKQALEILQWMENQNDFRLTPGHHALMMELIVKVNGLNRAGEYFERISGSASKKSASLPLLHGYVKERDIVKAESFMIKLSSSGLLVTPHPYNEMMKLYMALSLYEKVPLVIAEMKRNKLCRNVLSYNLWMGAFGEVFEVAKAEMVYMEMVSDENVEVGWSTLASLANVYIKAGFVDKALLVLKDAEMKLSSNGRLGYFFLITLYSSLKNKEGVLRLWEASKAAGGRIPCADYMCVISCLVKAGDLVAAERVFAEWETNCSRYDIRVSNVLLGAYVRNGLMKKAESFHLHTVERGGCPNYKTWEILMEGWVKSQKMDKAIDAMRKAFSVLKLERCDWRPSHSILMAIAEHFEKHGNFEDANHYIKAVHGLGVATLPLYKLLLRMSLKAQRPACDILKMMEKDRIELDDETSALAAFNS
ncbi:hypothetical protein OIU85_017951 [Salix viminalis]|uniref:Pentacotripeptide-repeat region of PRORP domain-containing protein n=1 Tax=Salix viminalis TaxID=40686 RepID=A0A9Q0USN1_SALVM|nr:hypothetical protein OIU85_017951 [Salix viminalis]